MLSSLFFLLAIGAVSAADHTMGFIGCSMAENVAQGYVADGGKRMWPNYGTSGQVVQSWTDVNSASWKLYDQQVAKYGKPDTVWVQICIFAQQGATADEVKKMIANARAHSNADAAVYLTGQPLYEQGRNCFLAGDGGANMTDTLAKTVAADTSLVNVTYPGSFLLHPSEVQDGCHANTAGQKSLGQQALAFWG